MNTFMVVDEMESSANNMKMLGRSKYFMRLVGIVSTMKVISMEVDSLAKPLLVIWLFSLSQCEEIKILKIFEGKRN
ncbi:hypothetical protein JTB14_001635 [Gonioctena quinquepunctata]|nr:hypothetical protein JTB14_001635 [Gonioctena quinquepunctata]